METKLRKIWPLVGAMCASLLCGSAFAHDTNQNSSSSTYGSSMDSNSQSEQGTYQRGTFREITPSAGPRVAHGADVSFTADFIYWKVSDEGLAFSATGKNTSETFDSKPTKGKVASVGEKWAPGFKVGLGLSLGHDGWDVSTKYTWLQASESEKQKDPTIFTPLAEEMVEANTKETRTKSDWRRRINVLDLELGRNFFLSQFLTMRPFIGLKGTWQKADYKVKTYGTIFAVEGVLPSKDFSGPIREKNRSKVWGIGPRAGFNLAWSVTKSFSVYGNLAFSTLWTEYTKDSYKGTLVREADNTTRTAYDLSPDNRYACRFVTETELGLRWETWFYDDSYHFAVQAGWEAQVWNDWSSFMNTTGRPSSKDLTMQGLTLSFRFDF